MYNTFKFLGFNISGYVSFVYNQPGEGSLMIKHLTKVFLEFAAAEDIDRLLIRVGVN